MRSESLIRGSALGVTTLTVLCLSACTGHLVGHLANSHTSLALDKQQIAPKQQRKPAASQVATEQAQAKLAADNKAISILLGQSDAALKQAQSLRNQEAKIKDKKKLKAFDLKVQQAQAIADQKAQALVAAKQDLDAQLAAIANAKKQVNGVAAKDQVANSVAAADELPDEGLSDTPPPPAPKDNKRTRRIAHRHHHNM